MLGEVKAGTGEVMAVVDLDLRAEGDAPLAAAHNSVVIVPTVQ